MVRFRKIVRNNDLNGLDACVVTFDQFVIGEVLERAVRSCHAMAMSSPRIGTARQSDEQSLPLA